MGRLQPIRPAVTLSPLEVEVIDFFVQVSTVLGQPRSFAELYGLLFISPAPLAMDDLIARLQISKGSASQGLKFLRNLGAVQTVYVAADRRVHYEAVAELRKLVTRFLSDQVSPHLAGGQARLENIAAVVRLLPAPERARVMGRVALLQSWGRRGKRLLPLVVKVIGG